MSQAILFKKDDEQGFWKGWEYIASQLHAGPAYMKSTLEYAFEHALDGSRDSVIDKSFLYLENKNPVAAAFLLIEKGAGAESAMTFRGGYLPSPLFLFPRFQKQVFSLIDEIAKDSAAGKIMFSLDPLMGDSFNYLQRYGYLDSSILSYVIDLTKADLLKACRKGHQSDIKKMLEDKTFEIFFVDAEHPSYELHEEYRLLHAKCAGRVTRPKNTFDLQFEQLKQGHAVLVGLRYKEKNIGYSYFEYSFDKALYASSADDPEYEKLPLYHVIIFRAMEYLQKKGVRFLNTSQPSSPSIQFDYYPDAKQRNIALFKRGFGGNFRMQFQGIKYFSKELFQKDAQEFIKQYARSLSPE